MKAAIQMNRALDPEELLQVNGGVVEAIDLSENGIADILLNPFKKIIKKIIGPHLPDNFEVFYAIVKVSMAVIKMMIEDCNPLVLMAFEVYTYVLSDEQKRNIWRKVYNALRVEMAS